MRQLIESRLFSLLIRTSKKKDLLTELEEAYEEFAVTLLNKLQTETNNAKLYYYLSFVRLEFVEIRDILSDRQEKKMP